MEIQISSGKNAEIAFSRIGNLGEKDIEKYFLKEFTPLEGRSIIASAEIYINTSKSLENPHTVGYFDLGPTEEHGRYFLFFNKVED